MNPGIGEQLLAQRRAELLRAACQGVPAAQRVPRRHRLSAALGRGLVRAGNHLLAGAGATLAAPPAGREARPVGAPGC